MQCFVDSSYIMRYNSNIHKLLINTSSKKGSRNANKSLIIIIMIMICATANTAKNVLSVKLMFLYLELLLC